MAVENKMVAATLWQVPNQPIVFAQDPQHQERSEDAAVAFTWLEYIFHKDRDDFVLFFPMVKSVHSALTAIQQYTEQIHHVSLQQFVVCGASKRGWTTWLEGATDDRVVAIVPIVMVCLRPIAPNHGCPCAALRVWCCSRLNLRGMTRHDGATHRICSTSKRTWATCTRLTAGGPLPSRYESRCCA